MIVLLLHLGFLLASTSWYAVGEYATKRRARSGVCLRRVCNVTSLSICAAIYTVDDELRCMLVHELSADYFVNVFPHPNDWLTFHDVVLLKFFNADTIEWYDTPQVIDRLRWDVHFKGRLIKIYNVPHEVYLVSIFGIDPTYHGRRHHSTTTASPTNIATTRRRHSSTMSPPTLQHQPHDQRWRQRQPLEGILLPCHRPALKHRALTTFSASSTPTPTPTSMQWTSRPRHRWCHYTPRCHGQ